MKVLEERESHQGLAGGSGSWVLPFCPLLSVDRRTTLGQKQCDSSTLILARTIKVSRINLRMTGAPDRSRTDADDLAGIALCPLSYGGICNHYNPLVTVSQAI
jgi:hypothetical protein